MYGRISLVVAALMMWCGVSLAQETQKMPLSPYPNVVKPRPADPKPDTPPAPEEPGEDESVTGEIDLSGGAGVLYGGLGGNISFRLSQYLSITAGAGSMDGIGLGGGGVRFHIPSENEKMDLRFTVFGGNIGIETTENPYGPDSKKALAGAALGFDANYFLYQDLFLNLGIFLATNGDETQGTFSAGIGWRFDLPSSAGGPPPAADSMSPPGR